MYVDDTKCIINEKHPGRVLISRDGQKEIPTWFKTNKWKLNHEKKFISIQRCKFSLGIEYHNQ